MGLNEVEEKSKNMRRRSVKNRQTNDKFDRNSAVRQREDEK